MSQAGYEKKIQMSTNDSPHTMVDLPFTTATLNHGGDVLDDTNMRDISASGMRSRILGLRDWSISGTMLYDGGLQAVTDLRDAWLNRTELFVNYLPNGVVADGFGGPVVVETFNMNGEVGGLEQVEVSLLAAGDLGAAIT